MRTISRGLNKGFLLKPQKVTMCEERDLTKTGEYNSRNLVGITTKMSILVGRGMNI